MTGMTPVPLKLAVCCGLLKALSLTVRFPENGPVVVGAKVTLIVQLDSTPNVAGDIGQLLVWVKPVGVLMLLMVTLLAL